MPSHAATGPQPPKMRVVTKGWWVLKEERRSVEELQREDRNRGSTG